VPGPGGRDPGLVSGPVPGRKVGEERTQEERWALSTWP